VEKRKVVTNIKVTSSNINNNKSRSNLGIKWKTQKPQAKDKERKETNTPQNVYPNSVQIDLLGGEIDLSNSLLASSLQIDIKELQLTRN